MTKKITITVETKPDGEIQTGIEAVGMTKFELLGVLRFHEKRTFMNMIGPPKKKTTKQIKKTTKK